MARAQKAVGCLELQLTGGVSAAGQHISGIVKFCPVRPTNIRALTVHVAGRETPQGASVSRSLRRTASFFNREILLSGMEQPQLTHERVSQIWNAFLGRDRGRILSPGEHTYPFSIPLPASLPPSYDGKAGRVIYTVTAKAQYPLGRTTRVTREVKVAALPRPQRTRPVALTYPSANGAVHANEVSVNLELPRRAVMLGEPVSGRISISNPKGVPVSEVAVSLERCEWVNFVPDAEMERRSVGELTAVPENPKAESYDTEFDLLVPQDASPTVEGTNISVLWLLRIRIDTDPAVEFKTPVFVYSPVPNQRSGCQST